MPQAEEKYHDERGLIAAIAAIEYQPPEGAPRVPWLEQLDITVKSRIPDDFDVDKNIERENLFVEMTLEGVKEGLSKLKYLNVPYARPADYMAEMMKSDEHMSKVLRKLERDF